MKRFHPQWPVLGFIGTLTLIAISILPIFQSIPNALAASTVTGTVFQDYNANGIKDTGNYIYSGIAGTAIDQGIGNIVVSAFDASGLVGTTTTAANGTFTLASSGSGTVRIEYSNLPAGFQPGPNGGAVTPDGAPAGVIMSGTLVQFVAAGSAANLGLIRPEEYCQNNPQLVYSCYKSGDPLGGGTAGSADTLFSNPYSANGTTPLPTAIAKNVQTGAVWGEAWQRDTKQLFTAAFVKRHTGLGTLGTGGIYVTNLATASPTTSPYIDVKTLGINTGSFATARGLPASITAPSEDIEAFAHIGKLGIGGIALSDDGTTLWLINLKDRTLYSIAIGNPAKPAAALSATDVTSYAATAPWLTAPACTRGVARPFGTKYYRGKVYVGVICSAESAGGTAANLSATVYALDPATAAFSTVISLPLNFKRGIATGRISGSNFWYPWTDTYSDAAFRPGTVSDCCGGLQVSRPMPILSDLEFDASGALILGFVDRASHQFGNGHPRPIAGDTAVLFGNSGGDILRACPNISGVFILESNGSCGGQAGSGVANGQGPGNGEFYAGDNFNITDHQETSLGGLAYLPGSPLTVMAGSDPLGYNSGGPYWMSNVNGTSVRRYEIYTTTGLSTFGKAGGMGDVILLCDAAPIEIGNRIWRDDDGDGVQDPAEPGIAGATVNLYAPDGTTVLATAVTDASGNYYFSSAAGTSTTSTRYGISGLTPNTSGYSIRLDNPANYASAGPLAGIGLSAADASANSQDQRDSDATIIGGFPRIPITTGVPGANNHSYDIGFVPYSIGNRVWFDTNNNGLIDASETGIANVAVSLYADANGDGVPDSLTPLAISSTDTSGYYRFDGLLTGTYVVKIDPVNFQAGGALIGRFSSSSTEATPNSDIDSNDNGIDTANQAANGILSGPITLGPGGSEPVGEADLSATGQGSVDAQANMTVDFGFYEKLSLGNFVWYDTNNNGQVDSGEQPIAGVAVRLFADTNGNGMLDAGDVTASGDQTTDANGQYLFTGLDAGNYFVQILPANFASGGALDTYSNSSGTFPGDANNNKDHGTPVAGQGVVSELVTLTNGGESITDGDSNANSNLTIDFGFYKLTIGNQVWRDDNNNGLFDTGEAALAGVRIELYSSTNSLIAVTTTDANGQYLFDQGSNGQGTGTGVGLTAGDYYVKIPASQFATGSSLPGYHSSTGNDAGDAIDNNDNGIELGSPATNGISSPVFSLTPGGEPTVNAANGTTSNTTIDFGLYTMSLGNLVWNDANNNGIFDTGEQPLQSVVVNLYYDADGNGTITAGEATTAYASTSTDAAGHYLFTGLAAGNYIVELPASNFAVNGPYQGYYTSTGAVSYLGPFEAAPDPDLNTADGRDNGSWLDTTGPLLFQSGIVTLVAGNEPTSAIETDGQQAGDTAVDANSNLTLDFGLYQSVSIGNRVWVDTNNNGVKDSGEISVPDGVILNLYHDANGNGILDGSETTAVATTTVGGVSIPGEYLFAGLVPGNYMVEVDKSNFAPGGLLAGYTSSTGTNGSLTGPNEVVLAPETSVDDTDDNGSIVGLLGSGGSIQSKLITLTFHGEPVGDADTNIPFPATSNPDTNLTIDFGVFQPARLGNFVWFDTDLDGVQGAGEAGVPNVTVTLYDTSEQVVATTTTDANGFYQFTNLAPGNYHVAFSTLPTGFVFTGKDQGGDDTADSDANPITGETAGFTLAPGDNNQTIDAGIYNDVRASLGNFVWYDTNQNGVQDAGELGVPGVKVVLYEETAPGVYTQVAATTTTLDGAYLFSGLLSDNYYVDFIPPAGYLFSGSGLGGDATLDSDAAPATGQTTPTHLDPGEADLTWDAGIYYSKVALGDRVWRDTNNDGIDNGFGGGLPGITVNLYVDSNGDGTPEGGILKTTITDANGFYLFKDLDPNTYIVEVIAPAGYISSTGTNGASSGPYEAAPDPDNDINGDDNGTTVGAAVRSGPITLTVGGEPLGETIGQSNLDALTPDANSNLTVDFGFFQPLSLGNQIWHDANDNGIIDGSESGIPSVIVKLYDAANNLVASTITDASGNYLFTNLGRGDYTVEVLIPAGYVSSTDITSSALVNNNIDNDDNGVIVSGGTVRSGTISLYPNDEAADDPTFPAGNANRNPTVDFGFYQPLSLGNLVWYDLNNNGSVDPGENGVPGVLVTLYRQLNYDQVADPGEFVGTTLTDSTGHYLFDNLRPGDYVLVITPDNFAAAGPLDHYASSTGNGSEPVADPTVADNNTTDNNDNGSTYQPDVVITGMIHLASGQAPTTEDGNANTNLTIDFGFYPLAVIGDYVWLDSNQDGVQDAGEPRSPGVVVTLYQLGPDNVPNTHDDVPVATTTTGPNGDYHFADLIPGDYFVQFALPPGYAFSPQDSSIDSIDSDADATTGSTAVTTLTAGENDPNWDAGLIYNASLGDRAWLDVNGNGIQDTGELGVPGVTVALFSSAGIQVGAATTTDAKGNYTLSNVPPGDYYLVFTPPTGYRISPSNQAGDDTADSDGDPATGRTATITIALGIHDPNWDIGLYRPLSLGNQIWHDMNDNALFDAGETGLSNVTIRLYASDGTTEIPVGPDGVLGTADDAPGGMKTDASGQYLFSNLAPGSYIVDVTTPSGYVSSTNIASSGSPNNDIDNNDNGVLLVGTSVRSGIITLITGTEPADDPSQAAGNADRNPTVDFGFYQPLSLGNLIWRDNNNNGVVDGGESGIDGVTVELYRDANNNGQLDAGEFVATQTTSGGGQYLFSNLRAGDYIVVLPISNFAAGQPLAHLASSTGGGSEPGSDPDKDINNDDNGTTQPDGSVANVAITLISAGEPKTDGDTSTNTNLSLDFGLYPLASIGNYVWLDSDGDGVQDGGESGVAGVDVQLYISGADGLSGTSDDILWATTITDASGNYQFIDLVPGDYYVQFVLPAAYSYTSQDSSSATDATNSDANMTTGRTAITTLTPGENDTTWDAGLYHPVSLGNLIWSDDNNNGIVDSGESGIDGVVVKLYHDVNGNGKIDAGEFVATQNTSGGGQYLFQNLAPGSYLVQLDPANFSGAGVLVGYASSTGSIGTNLSATGPYEAAPSPNNDINNDDDGTTIAGQGIVSAPIALTSGGEPINDDDTDPNSNLTIDFGVFQPASLGSIVWYDTNKNGVRDTGELGVPGVTVTLYDSSGSSVATTTTDADGGFLFKNLTPGSYTVGFGTLPSGYIFTPENQGSNDADDSDADPITGMTSPIALVPGQNNLTLNAGIVVDPTAIALASFSATHEGEQIVLRWVTTAEINTWGFQLYRSANGTRASAIRVTPQLIFGQGRGQGGASYRWSDTEAAAGVPYTYWLSETEIGGATNEYGPATTSVRLAGLTYHLLLPLAIR